MNSRTLTLKRDADVAWICRFALDDARLTWKAKGLLLYLVNMVPGTTVNWSDIGDHSADGKDAVNGARKELAALGYLSETASGVHVTDGNAENPQKDAADRAPRQSRKTRNFFDRDCG